MIISDEECQEDTDEEGSMDTNLGEPVNISSQWIRMDDIELKEEDKQILDSGEMWLNDNIMNAAQNS